MEYPRAASLSPKQKECLRLIYNRRTGGHIARALNISKNTVESHLAQARKTLGVTTSVEAAEILHAYENDSPPRDLTSQTAPLAEPLPDTTKSEHWSPAPQWRAIMPFRNSGKQDNDLSIRHRLAWIVAIAIGAAIALGSVANFLHFISDIIRR